MGPESSILIKRSKVSDVWVTAFGGNNSGNQESKTTVDWELDGRKGVGRETILLKA